jgi:tRNA uridine 5-carbamoylmethylation protein Kti12
LLTLQNSSSKSEFECEFLGSVNTLINPSKLRNFVYDDPIKKNDSLYIYENPKEEIII